MTFALALTFLGVAFIVTGAKGISIAQLLRGETTPTGDDELSTLQSIEVGSSGVSSQSEATDTPSAGAETEEKAVRNLVTIGRQLRREGFQVGENAALGDRPSPGSHAAGGYHYRFDDSGAIDVNYDGKKMPEKEKLDELAARLTKAGWQIIWQSEGHYDHLHADVRGGGGSAPLPRAGKVWSVLPTIPFGR